MPAGRPLQLTSEIIETILDLMIAIPHLKTIAARVEVCARTLRRWFKSGNDEWARRCAGEEPDDRLDLHYHLVKEYAKTGALIMTYHLDFVQQGFPGWRRHAKKLETRFPDEVGSDTRVLRRLRRQLAALDEKERINSSGTYSSGTDSTNDPSSLDANSSNQSTSTEETTGIEDKIPYDENASIKRRLESRVNKGLRSIQDINTLGAILREEEMLRQFVKDPEQFTNHNLVDVDYFLDQGIKRDWRAWTWFLERRFPKEFGPNRVTIRHLKGIIAARKILANCKSAGGVTATDRAKIAKIKRKYLNDEFSLESDDDEDLVDELDEDFSIDEPPSEFDNDEDSVDDFSESDEERVESEDR